MGKQSLFKQITPVDSKEHRIKELQDKLTKWGDLFYGENKPPLTDKDTNYDR